jgi:hypothetical protein
MAIVGKRAPGSRDRKKSRFNTSEPSRAPDPERRHSHLMKVALGGREGADQPAGDGR